MFTVSANVRKLGESPSQSDLSSAIFKFGTKFTPGEIVLVPRSRGGFVYGKATKPTKKENCYFGTTKHPHVQWQVEYPDANGHALFKCQPSNLLGQLPAEAKSPVTATNTTNQNRSIGAPASARDLSNVVFNNLNKFQVGDIVLVPRSSGGFTYGEIISPAQVTCLLPLRREDRHQVNGWKIVLDAKKSMKKELANWIIGKLPLCGAQLEMPPIVSLPEPSTVKRKPNPKKLKKKPKKRRERGDENLNRRFKELSSNLTPAAEIETITVTPEDNNSSKDLQDTDLSGNDKEYENSNSSDEEESESETIFFKPNQQVTDLESSEDNESSEEEEEEIEDEEEDEEEEIFIAPPRGVLNLPNPLPMKSTGNSSEPKKPKKKCLVVLDAPNIARKHGKKEFSAKGIVLCADYWTQRGHEVVAFLPEHYVSTKPSTGATVTLAEYLPKVDNMALIEQLEKRGILFYTPPQDYDDSYCIKYARSNNGVIVTNDLYRDHIEGTCDKERGRTRYWIKTHCISFTFVKDQFLPNPDFKFPSHCVS